ncbi:MAG TPA: DUF6152 family protein [Gammaproteobacteria bacterium]|nr:DUF6152 family protein [Gammaproteobacteria bacterium]
MSKRAASLVALAALACAGPLGAHHSISTVDITTPVWVKGTVVRYEIGNPHTMIELDVKMTDKQVVRWTLDGPFLGRVERMHVDETLLKRGDVIEVCGFHYKSQRLAHAETGAPLPPFMHADLLVMPDGRMQPWGPYGKLNNCVRPDDDSQSWVDFLNNDAIARQLWCHPTRTSVPTVAAAKPLAEAIDRRLAIPCP